MIREEPLLMVKGQNSKHEFKGDIFYLPHYMIDGGDCGARLADGVVSRRI
jgi:hypothetical protein